MKSKSTMFFLWLFTGLFGGHRFYVGKNLSGIVYLFTFGLLFIGWGLDFFRLGSMVDNYNLRYGLMHGAMNQNANQNNNHNNIVINMATSASPAPAQVPVEGQAVVAE